MDDIDILSIHNEIISKISENQKNLKNFEESLENVKKCREKNNLSLRIKNNLNRNIEELEYFINDIKNSTTYNFYIMESTPIIEEYKNELIKPIKLSFMGKNISNTNIKDNLIKKFLEISKKYINNSYSNIYYDFLNKDISTNFVCKNCKNTKLFDSIDNDYICLECGAMSDYNYNNSSYKDVERVNITSKYTYEREIHFRDCINQYQGKQNTTIDQTVYDALTSEFEKHGLLIGNKTTNKFERFSKITKEHIYLFLKETGYAPKHYEDVVLIHYNLTGKLPDDISHLEPKLLDDFKELIKLYDEKYKKEKKIERRSFINTQYVLFQLLKKHKYPCKKEDFNMLKTIDRLEFHDEVCKDLFEQLGWNFSPLL